MSTTENNNSSSRGRPKKPEEDRRTISHGLYLSPKEKEELERRSDAAGLSISEYLRRKALGGEPVAASSRQETRRFLQALAGDLRELIEAVDRDAADRDNGEEETVEEIADALREKVENIREMIRQIR